MAGRGHARAYTQSDSAGGSTGTVWMPIGGVLDGVHSGATWRIRLNRLCAAAMRPDVKLLDQLFCIVLHVSSTYIKNCRCLFLRKEKLMKL